MVCDAVLVDDDARYLRATARLFAKAGIERLHLFERTELALEHLAQHATDLVVLDYQIPEHGGIEACHRIKTVRDVRVVMVSGNVSAEMREAAVAAGAERVLQKPCNVIALLGPTAYVAGATETLSTDQVDMARRIARQLSRRYGSLISPDDIDGLALLGMCEAARRYDPNQDGPFMPFAASRVRGAVLDELRRVEQRHRITPPTGLRVVGDGDSVPSTIEDIASGDVGPDVIVDQAALLARLRVVRAALGPADEKLVALRYDQELSTAAIARELGISENRAAAQLARMHERIGKALQQELRTRTTD